MEDKVYHQVIEHIKQLAREKKIAFGDKIPSERELMETLGFSRNSIREAVRTLEHMGLLESRHGKGNFLIDHMGESLSSVFSLLIFMKGSDYLEVNHLRRAMEVQAFDEALERLDEEARRKFAELMEPVQEDDYHLMMERDRAFHKMLFECSGNHLLEMLMQALSQVCREEIQLILENATKEYAEWWRSVHDTIYKCLINGDREAGMAAIEEHYQWVDQQLRKIIAGSDKIAVDLP